MEPPEGGVSTPRTQSELTRIAFLIAFAHAMNDAYAAFLHPLLPRVMDRLGLSIALAAVLTATLSLASALPQPLFGYLSDRFGRRFFVVGGPIVSGVFFSMIGVAPTYSILLLFLVLGGIGSAAFHPPGASAAARISEGKGSGLRLSVFSSAGMIGYAAGPLIAVGTVSWIGLERLWYAMIPGLILGLLIWRLLPPRRAHVAPPKPPPGPIEVLRLLAGPLGIVFGISAAGSFAQRVFTTMMPIAIDDVGGSEASIAALLTVYLLFQGIGTLAGGIWTDRFDRVRLLTILTSISLPAHLFAVWVTPGSAWGFALAAIAGFANMAMLPAIVIIAQELLPDSASVGSGIVMGLAWAVGSVAVMGAGVVGDQVGAQGAAVYSMPVLMVAIVLARHPALRAASGSRS